MCRQEQVAELISQGLSNKQIANQLYILDNIVIKALLGALIARALYRKQKISLLDETTSHLDINNESIVNKSIKTLNITRIIVAHRKETIKSTDRVINL
jgi:ABC-type molybdenum transport system ATPase subunit/photorepair protein PhrA